MNPSREIHVEFRNTLGNFTLDAVFTVPAAGITMLFGPSGCGKTTVLRCIAGLIHVKDGFCDIAGEVWQERSGAFVPTYRRPLGYVFQEASLFPHISVRRNLLFGAPKKHHDGPVIAFDEVVDLLGIRALLDRSPRNLSGGERQRVGIGRALLSQPKVLLMDEPLSALDRRTKGEILPFIEKLRDHFALPIFYVTHDMAEVQRLADQMVLLDKGRVVAVGPLAELQADPHAMLATAPEAAVSLQGVIEEFDDRFGLLRVAVPGGHVFQATAPGVIGEQVRVRILAADVSLARDPPGRSSILNVLPARIIAMNALSPHEVMASVALGENGGGARILACLSQKSWQELGFATDQNVFVQIKSVKMDRASAPDTPL
jgi:molybdate transport system ATP-binding protein